MGFACSGANPRTNPVSPVGLAAADKRAIHADTKGMIHDDLCAMLVLRRLRS